MSKNKNPYGIAADAYGSTAISTDPRALEGTVLLKAAEKLDAIAKRLEAGEDVPRPEIVEALDFNRKLWTIFATDVADPHHPMPQEIRNNIASLGLFVFKHTVSVQAETKAENFTVLININRTIAAGLLKQPSGAKEKGTKEKPAAKKTDAATPAEKTTSKTDSLA